MNDQVKQQVVLITGASSGIGRSCAELLHQQGYRVYGTSRTPTEYTTEFPLLPLDVNNTESVSGAVRHILEMEGNLDVLINNAGYGLAGSLEDTSITEMKQQFETNFFGMVRVIHAVLPIFRKQEAGLIVNISSIAGRIAVPFQSAYSASKYAVEGLTEALRMEVRSFGIRVVMIEPGDFRTGFTDKRKMTAQAAGDSVYSRLCRTAVDVMVADERQGHSPDEIARLVAAIIPKTYPRLRYSVGPWLERLAIHLRKLLPSGWFEWMIRQTYKL